MDKERKIAFYTLVKDMWANNADGLEGLIPFYEIKEVFNYIDGRKRRSLKLKSNKACSLESFSMKQDSKDSSLKSATKLFSVLLASKRPLITELADKLRLKYPLLPTISPCPTMRLEAIRSIIPISCRRYPKSV